jgi:outer membrane receptor protein involved in Fe transport
MSVAIASQSSAALSDPVHPGHAPNDKSTPVSSLQASARPGERHSFSSIVVTGSRIPRSDLTAVSPITIMNDEEFKLAGATNVEELLNQLPQVNPSQGEFFGAGATGAATIDLRGLGAVRTLVLVDGHRLMPGDPRYPVPDINSIPTSIIRRVEVLTGGDAAVYGSDAVAGVVNFILDTKLDGLKIEGQIGAFQHDNRDTFARGLLDQRQLTYPKGSVFDGDRENLSVAFGRSFFDDRAHVTIYGGFRRLAEVKLDQRDYGACPITAKVGDDGPTSILECGGPLVSYPGNFFDNLGNIYQVTTDRAFVPGVTRFNSSLWNLYQRPDKRYTAGGFADFELSNAVQAYAEVMAMEDRSIWQIGPSGDFRNTQTINCDNPLLSAQQHSLICRTGNFVGEIPALDDNGNLVAVLGSPTPFVDPVTGATYSRAWLIVSRRDNEGGPIQDDLQHKSIRLLGGVKGDLGRGVTYDASYLFGEVTLNRQYRNNLSISRLGKALDVISDPSRGQPVCRSVLIARDLGPSAPGADANCVPWDIFAIGQVTSQATAYLTVPPFMSGSFRQQVANLNATVELDRWGIGSPWSQEGPAINFGAEYRKDFLQFEPDEFSQAGDIAGFGEQVFPIRGAIDAKEVFAEARIPLVTDKLLKRLAFEGAFRHSWYDNPRSRFSSSAYKLALDLTAVSWLGLRASQQRAIRAPNVLELFAPVESETFTRDPCAGNTPAATHAQCALTGVTSTEYGHVGKVDPTVGYNAVIGGNEDLQAETATTRSLGMVFRPRRLRNFNATIDWWDIKLKGAISKIGAQAIVDSCIASGAPIFCGRIHRDPNGSLSLGNGYVDDRQTNLGGLKARGIDVNTDYSVSLGRLGAANFQFRGSYVLRWIVDNGGPSTPYDCAGLFGGPCSMQPRWKHTARATLISSRAISVSLQWRRVGGVKLAALDPKFNMTDNVSPGYTKLRPQGYFDLSTLVRVRKGTDLRLGVNNLFDRQPPLVVGNTAAGDGPFNSNTYPEWYDVLGRYIFASVAVAFKP